VVYQVLSFYLSSVFNLKFVRLSPQLNIPATR